MMGPLRGIGHGDRGEVMDVEFVLRADDLLALHRYLLQRRPRAGNGLWAWVVAGVLLLALWLWLGHDHPIWTDTTLPLIMAVGFLALVAFAVFQRQTMPAKVLTQLRKQLDDEWNRKLLGWRRLSLTAESITFISELTTFSVRWPAVEQIVTTEDHAIFLVTRQTGLILPVRAFRDEEAFREFVKAARRYRKEANAATEDDSPPRRRSRVEETGFTADEPADD
jgi:hypothetical protein